MSFCTDTQMSFFSNTYAFFGIVGGLFPLLFVRPALANRDKPGATGLLVCILGAIVYALSISIRSFGFTGAELLVVQSTVMLGGVLGAVGWFLLFAEYTGLVGSTRRALYALGGFAAVLMVVIWTNPLHHLFYDPTAELVGDTSTNRRALFWLFSAVMYGLVFVATGSIVRDIFRSQGIRRRQAIYLLGGSVPPVVTIAVSGTAKLVPVDITPVGFVAGTAVLTWAMFRADFLEIVSVGRTRVVENTNDPFVTLDEERRVVDSNPTAREIFGVGDGWDGTPAREFFSPFVERIEQVWASDDGTEISIDRDGTQYHFDVQTTPIYGPQDEQRGEVLIFRDVTAIKEREQELQQKNELLDEFASVVSHDVATPLGVIENKARLIEVTGETGHAADIYDASERVQKLVDELRHLAQAGEEIGDTEPVELEGVTRDAWESVAASRTDLTVADSKPIDADPVRLRQLLENLLENSVEHGSTSPDSQAPEEELQPHSEEMIPKADGDASQIETLSITVGTLPDGFYVADDGPGIPEDEREAIFDQGYTTAEDGAGLGLAIVSRIVDGHGWAIQVAESDDGGARFEIRSGGYAGGQNV